MPPRNIRNFLIIACTVALVCSVRGQPTAHYPPGIHGLNAATLPGPGFYLRDYNLFYTSDRLNNSTGDRSGPANFEAFTYANVLRPIWITDVEVLSGYLGTDVVIPLVDRQLRSGTFDSSTFGLGDVCAEGTLSWHTGPWDGTIGAGEWLPTGDSAARPTTRPGLGYWTTMLTLGAIWYIDNSKTWSVSALNRYEINGEGRNTHTTTGDAWTLEWGLGKALTKFVYIGAAGYYQAKVTGDRGDHPQPRNRVAAVGPELTLALRPQGLTVSLRYDYEFEAESRAQGHTVVLALTKQL